MLQGSYPSDIVDNMNEATRLLDAIDRADRHFTPNRLFSLDLRPRQAGYRDRGSRPLDRRLKPRFRDISQVFSPSAARFQPGNRTAY